MLLKSGFPIEIWYLIIFGYLKYYEISYFATNFDRKSALPLRFRHFQFFTQIFKNIEINQKWITQKFIKLSTTYIFRFVWKLACECGLRPYFSTNTTFKNPHLILQKRVLKVGFWVECFLKNLVENPLLLNKKYIF